MLVAKKEKKVFPPRLFCFSRFSFTLDGVYVRSTSCVTFAVSPSFCLSPPPCTHICRREGDLKTRQGAQEILAKRHCQTLVVTVVVVVVVVVSSELPRAAVSFNCRLSEQLFERAHQSSTVAMTSPETPSSPRLMRMTSFQH